MEVIRPTAVTDAILLSSDVPEGPGTAYNSGTTYALNARVDVQTGTVIDVYSSLQAANIGHAPASSPTWWRKIATTYALHNPGTTYVKGERVISTVTHRIYESLQPSNVGHDPTLEASAAWWLDIGPTNRWAMFDQVVGTATVGTGSVTVSLAPGSLDSLAILDTDAELINVVMTVSGVEVYNSTQSTNVGGNSITDWKLYFFEPIGKKKQVLFLDIPPGYSGAQMSITFTGADPAGPVKVGTVNFGNILFIGDTEQGLKVGVTSFSKVGQDEFGVFSIVKRAKARKFSGRCLLLSENVDPINDALIALLDTPCVWIASRFFDATIAYAFFNDFEIDIEAGAVSFCTLTLQGLT